MAEFFRRQRILCAGSYTNRLTRTVGGVTENYAYDDADKLQDVKIGGVTQKSYGYDTAGRTTSVVCCLRTILPTNAAICCLRTVLSTNVAIRQSVLRLKELNCRDDLAKLRSEDAGFDYSGLES